MDNVVFQNVAQINGSYAHRKVDDNQYSTSKEIITSLDGYSEKYNIICRIDILNTKTKTLIERKNHIKKIYDGYILQLYAQYYALLEMGYQVYYLKLYSMKDNKMYDIPLPEQDEIMKNKLLKTLDEMMAFDMNDFKQNNADKCRNCIYESACDRSLLIGDDSDD